MERFSLNKKRGSVIFCTGIIGIILDLCTFAICLQMSTTANILYQMKDNIYERNDYMYLTTGTEVALIVGLCISAVVAIVGLVLMLIKKKEDNN